MTASAILLAVPTWDPQEWLARFRSLAGDREIRLWPDAVGDARDIAYVCAWKTPRGAFAGLPNLRAIFSLGAGADFLMGDPALPDVPIVRIVDPNLTQRMTEYIVLQVLMFHRQQRVYDEQQRKHVWYERPQPAASEVAVGVMGLGVLGRDAAGVLRRIGFRVAGWSRTPHTIAGIECFHGSEGLGAFLARTEILVVLLPHTPATEGVLNLALFRKLERDGALNGAFLVNAGRGRLQVDADIVAALDEGSLAGAALDVFPVEPLPQDSPLWDHPKITVTPHAAAASVPDALVANVMRQIARLEAGQPPENMIDRAAGY
jgi:glyoxylate/hydroxypyruvate reductase A